MNTLTNDQVKAYKASAIELTNHQRDAICSYGYFIDREVSAKGWAKLGMDSNNVFIVGAGEIKMHYVLQNECGELLTHSDARRIILKDRGETI